MKKDYPKPAGNVHGGRYSTDNPRKFDECYTHAKVAPKAPKEGHLTKSSKRFT